MTVKSYRGKVFGAELTAAEKKARKPKMGYRKVGYLEQIWYILKYYIKHHLFKRRTKK